LEPSYERADARVRAIGGTSAEHLGAFVTWLGSQQYSAGYACIVARHALAFGRWCERRGVEVATLTDADVERFTWTTTPPVPKAIAAAHVQRAIDSCDRLTATGRRDRAVLLLLARLGLRACEIIRLTLDDIDWDQAQLRIRGKGGRQSMLPLPADVGEAIAAYLKQGRQTCEDRHIFCDRWRRCVVCRTDRTVSAPSCAMHSRALRLTHPIEVLISSDMPWPLTCFFKARHWSR